MSDNLLFDRAPGKHRAQIPDARAATALALAVLASLSGCSPNSDSNPPVATMTASNVTLSAAQLPNIQLYTVSPSHFHRTVETTGEVDFDNDQAASVLAPFGGPVTRVLVSPGDKVKAGDPLATVDSPDFATAISTYQKALATAKTDRQLADLDKDLISHHGVAQREAEQAQTDAANAEADAEAARQGLVSLNVDPQVIKDIQAGHDPARTEGLIRSPIAGTVAEKLIAPGALLQADTTPCFTVADLSKVWVMAQVFGSDLTTVKIGDSVAIETGIGTNNFTGTVDNISALVDPDTRSVVARVVVENSADFLKKQMYVRAVIQDQQESTGFLVPVAAVLRDDENLPFVYAAQADGSFARESVTLGTRIGDQYEIVAGIKTGDRIVVDGGIFVQFMQNQ